MSDSPKTPQMPPTMLVECRECMGEGVRLDLLDEEPCEPCEGQGMIPEVPCPVCEGAGCERCWHEGSLYDIECPACSGEGVRHYHPSCHNCAGRGYAPHPAFEQQ